MVSARRMRGVSGIASLGLAMLSGCAFPHGSMSGDPALGNFNRPIAPTPQPWAGGLGGGSPAYDGGARAGVVPDTTVNSEISAASRNSWFMPAPVLPASTDYSGAGNAEAERKNRVTWQDKIFSTATTKKPSDGAKLQSTDYQAPLVPIRPTFDVSPLPTSTAPRQLSATTSMLNGSSIQQDNRGTILRLVPPQGEKSKIRTVEEGQAVLSGYGMKWQNLQQTETGDWQFSCVISADFNGSAYRRYDAQHPDAVEAVRAVVDQATRDR